MNEKATSGVLGVFEKFFTKYLLGFLFTIIVGLFKTVVKTIEFLFQKIGAIRYQSLANNFFLTLLSLFIFGLATFWIKDFLYTNSTLEPYIKVSLFVAYKVLFLAYAFAIILFFLTILGFLAEIASKQLNKKNLISFYNSSKKQINTLGIFLQKNWLYNLVGFFSSWLLLEMIKNSIANLSSGFPFSLYVASVLFLSQDLLYAINVILSISFIWFLVWGIVYYSLWKQGFNYVRSGFFKAIALHKSLQQKENFWYGVIAIFVSLALLLTFLILFLTFGAIGFYGDGLTHLSLLAISLAFLPLIYYRWLKK
ncbi:MAG: hypothetical protein ACK5BE_03065 [Alphaproteobacteria bacterium]|jgi:hypothetical protein